MRNGDGAAIAARALPQRISRPTNPSDDAWSNEKAVICRGRGGTVVEAYELHNGKAPFYYSGLAAYQEEVSRFLSGHASTAAAADLVAVGCGAPNDAAPPDCGRSMALLYGFGPPGTRSFVCLIFVRAADAQDWRLEKFWTPYPSVVQEPIAPGTRYGIYTVGGTSTIVMTPATLP